MQASAETDPDMITYLVKDIPRQEWREWADTVTGMPLYDRIHELIIADTHFRKRSEFNDLTLLAGSDEFNVILRHIPQENWESWKDTIPRHKTPAERIGELIYADWQLKQHSKLEDLNMLVNSDEFAYVITDIPKDEWQAWRNTIPRDIEIQHRLKQLIRMDMRFGLMDAAKIVPLKAERVVIRSQEAINALNKGKYEKAEEEMRKVKELGKTLEGD